MWFSKLIVNVNRANVKLAASLTCPYEAHRTLSMAFPDIAQGGMDRVLFRIGEPKNGQCEILVQSEQNPDWSKLPKDGLLFCAVKEFNPSFRSGQMLRFSIKANTVRSIKDEITGKNKRIGLVKEDEQMEWLKFKASVGGFEVVSAAVTDSAKWYNFQKRAVHQVADFSGVIRITDPERFRQTIRHGIGHSKGFGLGMLLVAAA